MELRHLRYFIAVALEENVSKAALKLHVSQPALSRQVRDLEEELGFDLLERNAKSVRLTEAGHAFLEEASEVLERLEQGIEAARAVAMKDTGEIHVGYAPSLSPRLLPPILRAFQKRNPKVKVKLHDLSSEEMLSRIQDESLQFALIARPRKSKLRGLKFEPLQEEQIVLAVSPNHRYAKRKSVKSGSLKDEEIAVFSKSEYPDYHDLLERIFKDTKKIPKLGEESDGMASLISSVEVGNLVAIVTDSISCVAGERLKLVSLDPEPDPLCIGIAWKDGKLGDAETAFLDVATTADSP